MVQSITSISIIICFYNTEGRIENTLDHIKNLRIDRLSVELILVNNNSSDNSINVIESCMQDFQAFPWKTVYEPNPGLTHARMKGIEEAKHDILLFCDDDNWLQEDYLIRGIKRLNSDKKIGILGGLGEAVSTTPFPSWFEEHQNFYAVGPQFPEPGVVRGIRNVVYGAGMFMVKSYFVRIKTTGFKPISSDRKGNNLSSGGDSELCLAFQLAGYNVYYDDQLRFKHFIEEKRLTVDYLKRLKNGMAESRFVTRFYLDYLNGHTTTVGSLFWFKEFIYISKDLLKEVLTFNTKDFTRKKKFMVFLLKERNNYSRSVSNVLNTCHQLTQLKEHAA